MYGCNILADNDELENLVIKDCLDKCFQKFSEIETKYKNENMECSNGTQEAIPPTTSNVIKAEMLSKFETHLISMKFAFKKIHSIICRKDNIKVELAVCENGSSDEVFARVYVNRVRECNYKWANCLKALWQKEFKKVSLSQQNIVS